MINSVICTQDFTNDHTDWLPHERADIQSVGWFSQQTQQWCEIHVDIHFIN